MTLVAPATWSRGIRTTSFLRCFSALLFAVLFALRRDVTVRVSILADARP